MQDGGPYLDSYLLLDDVRIWLKNNATGHYRTQLGYFISKDYNREIWGIEIFLYKQIDAINFKLRWSEYLKKEKIGE